jgi:hypothetical protein
VPSSSERRPPRFVRDIDRALDTIKLHACPHCAARGTLNGHGWLRGYAETSSEMERRGRRVLCSNRNRRKGCGRTLSIFLADVIPSFSTRTRTLSRMLLAIVSGLSIRASWLAVRPSGTSLRNACRLMQRITREQPRLRSMACRVEPPPLPSHDAASHPLSQFVAHLQAAFSATPCFFESLQLHMQEALF